MLKSLTRISSDGEKTTIDLNIPFRPIRATYPTCAADDLILFCCEKDFHGVDVLADFSDGTFKVFNPRYSPESRCIFGAVNTSDNRHRIFKCICKVTGLPNDLVAIISDYCFY